MVGAYFELLAKTLRLFEARSDHHEATISATLIPTASELGPRCPTLPHPARGVAVEAAEAAVDATRGDVPREAAGRPAGQCLRAAGQHRQSLSRRRRPDHRSPRTLAVIDRLAAMAPTA